MCARKQRKSRGVAAPAAPADWGAGRYALRRVRVSFPRLCSRSPLLFLPSCSPSPLFFLPSCSPSCSQATRNLPVSWGVRSLRNYERGRSENGRGRVDCPRESGTRTSIFLWENVQRGRVVTHRGGNTWLFSFLGA